MNQRRVFVRPTKGRPVTGAPGSGRTVPVDGCEVVWSPWWAERVREGDLEIIEAMKAAKKTPATKEA